jgi:predicted metalloprotease
MRASSMHLVRFGLVLLLLAIALSPLGEVSAQDDATPGVDGSTYTSPSFGYTLSWDDSLWSVSDAYSADGYDLLTLATDSAALYIESFYFYQGDPADCLSGERIVIADENGLEDLDPLTDAAGTPIETIEGDVAIGLYDFPASGGAPESVVFLQCQPLIPGHAVLVITGFLDPAQLAAQLADVNAIIDSIELGASNQPTFDESDLEQVVQSPTVDIDSFWNGAFGDLGQSWVNPKFITFGETIETGCGDAVPEDSGPFYCPSDQTVYLDYQEMTNDMLPFGIIVIQVMIAHEIGHHVQALLDLSGCSDTDCGAAGNSLAIELQADCLAGAWMRDAAARDVVSKQDLKRVEVGVKTYFGDPPGTSQDDPDAHGSGDTRFSLFMEGYTDGIAACGDGL